MSVDPTPVRKENKEPKYVKREVTLVGYSDCGHCVDAEHFIKSELSPNSNIPVEYKKIEGDSPEGQKIIEEKNLEFVPFVKQCLIPKDPNEQPKCEEFKDFDKSKLKIKVEDE